MIKDSDLRFGNLLEYGDGYITVNINVLRDFNVYLQTGIKPIQLTEQWLLKAGFEKLTSIEKGFKSNSYTYSRGYSFIVHLNNGLLSTNFWQGNEKKYVHELQNLFFSLCGEELVFSTEP